MFNVRGNPILASEIEVLTTLRNQLLEYNIDVFRVLKPTKNNIMTTCPFHKGGMERKPSFGVSTKDDMVCHCFSCGWVGTLPMVISNLFGYEDDGAFGVKWLANTFLTVSIQTRKDISLDLSRDEKPMNVVNQYVTESELDSYRYIHPYMYVRGLTDEIINEFDVGYDYHTECITFPVLDIDKNCVFVARRSVNIKYFNYPEGVEKPVYGGYKIMEGNFLEVIICESILNSLTCWKYGKPAVALLGTGTPEQIEILKKLPVRKYIIATDPDEAGRRAANYLIRELSPYKIITQFEIPRGEDINSLDEKFLKLIEYF